ncbi:MAG: asparagine synthase (glutamine-hydrolyzing) [Oleiphilaceae bacterium]|jgi:asparagine synthase (glutamine-hydrolysing)
MCGIVGIKNKASGLDEATLLKMRDSFIYRGPDDAGAWADQQAGIGLGQRRLSILDPTPAGHQPMIDKANGNVLCYNGEVFNYIEVRTELANKGYTFETGTDTEVILKAYSAFGEDCVKHFNGMFAFAIWDVSQQHLFIARDRLGIKPFYYQLTDNGTFYFASEVKAIRVANQKAANINEGLIDQYMSFGYVPGAHTLEKGIMRLLPGHRGTVKNGQLSIEQYWDLDFSNTEDLGLDHYLKQGKALLNSAIDLRLRADVPLGIFLSGGIDSSAVVGLLAERTTERLKTFSIAYDFGEEFNETKYARMISDKFNTDHHELFLTTDQFKNFIPDFSYLMDEPVTESAAISLQFLSQLTKDHVTVVLSGEGSDEIFGGYDLYKYMSTIERYRTILGSKMASVLGHSLGALLPKNSKLTKYLNLSTQPLSERYKGISSYDERVKEDLYRPEFKQKLNQNRFVETDRFLSGLFEKNKKKDALSQMLYFDTKTWLVDDLLIKADRMSMAASLELRVPFLDYRLVEFAAKTPSKYKIRNGQGKYLLKEMMKGILPDEIINRKKMGFPTPLKMMFQGEMSDYAFDTLNSSDTKIHQYFDKSVIKRTLEEHTANKHDHHRLLWQLVVLEEWLKMQGRG